MREQVVDFYTTPQVIELDSVAVVTLGKYAEDSADQGKYFE
ncbi:putative RiPP precursor [Carbonactinospora thermoautotrophica]|nr:putative RiPP precursor [Carbonactinospora thermoautotrophica]